MEPNLASLRLELRARIGETRRSRAGSAPLRALPGQRDHGRFAARHTTHELLDGVAEVARVASATPETVSTREWDKGRIAAGRDDLPTASWICRRLGVVWPLVLKLAFPCQQARPRARQSHAAGRLQGRRRDDLLRPSPRRPPRPSSAGSHHLRPRAAQGRRRARSPRPASTQPPPLRDRDQADAKLGQRVRARRNQGCSSGATAAPSRASGRRAPRRVREHDRAPALPALVRAVVPSQGRSARSRRQAVGHPGRCPARAPYRPRRGDPV